MFEYFPKNYAWSLGVSASIAMGAEMSELEDALAALRPYQTVAGGEATEAWYQAWMKLAEKLHRMAANDERAGNAFSAGSKYKRAATYYLLAERIVSWSDSRRMHAYETALEVFEKGLSLSGDAYRRVEVPYEGGTLAGWLRLADGPTPQPAVLFYNGFDSIKEMHYLMMGEVAVNRGISVLYVDQEGTGEAVRRQHLPKRAESELSAGAFIDVLASMPEIDADRIGIIGLSMGGYCAPRAAAFEPRLKACVAFGAFSGIDDGWEAAIRGNSSEGLSDGLPETGLHAMHVTGTDSIGAALDVLKSRSLDGILDRITCPLLVAHGENDRQVSLEHARKTVAGAIHSAEAELRIFTIEEGGCEHVGIDNMGIQAEYIFDWLARHLGGRVA